MTSPPTRILGRCPFDQFTDRGEVQHRLLGLGRQAGAGASVALLAEPGAGTTELLRQTYDVLFHENNGIAPIYFELRPSDKTVADAARRFLRAFLLQMIAFRRRERSLLSVSATADELEQKALSADKEWVSELIRIANAEDIPDIIDLCFSAPARAAVRGAFSVVFIDGLSESNFIKDGQDLLRSIGNAASVSPVPLVIAGPRRSLFGKTDLPLVKLERLRGDAAATLVEKVADGSGIEINDETRDLIALQLDGDTRHIASVFRSASETGTAFTSFANFERVYTDELFGGRISRYFERILGRLLPGTAVDDLLHGLEGSSEADAGGWTLSVDDKMADASLAVLYDLELIDARPPYLRSSSRVFLDYARARSGLANNTKQRASVIGTALVGNVKRAPELMALMYRTRAALGLRDLFAQFQGQNVALATLDYSRFKALYKGLGDSRLRAELNASTDRVDLPRVLFSAYTADLYPRFASLCQRELSAAGLAANDVWLAVEIESKLEAPRELAGFWCDRLEMVAAANEFENFRLWLIAPEGFDDEALLLLNERQAIGSSRTQVELLREILPSGSPDETTGVIEEFERVVPMGQESEVLSARTVEEIGRRYDIPQRTLNQIKTALVEACINAAEHSLSPDRKLYQRFVIAEGKLTITVANRGVKLADTKLRLVSPSDGRRGWGLKLMRGLMDDVKIEDTDDGTRITMVKLLGLGHPAQTAAS